MSVDDEVDSSEQTGAVTGLEGPKQLAYELEQTQPEALRPTMYDTRNPVRPEPGTTLDSIHGLSEWKPSQYDTVKDFPYRNSELEQVASQEAAAMALTNFLRDNALHMPDINQEALAHETLEAAWKETLKLPESGVGVFARRREVSGKFTNPDHLNSLAARVITAGTEEEPVRAVVYGESNVSGFALQREDQRPVDTASRGIIELGGNEPKRFYWETSSVDSVAKLYKLDEQGKPTAASNEEAQQIYSMLSKEPESEEAKVA